MKDSYDSLLKKAYDELPKILKEHKRFKTPQVSSIIQGKITTLKNLGELSKAINRDVDILAKYFLRELGTMGDYDSQRLTIKGQFRTSLLQEKFENFLAEFVLCRECGRPDTQIVREKRINFLKCEACGSRHVIGGIKRMAKEEKVSKLDIGDSFEVVITGIGKKGDGIAKLGNYRVFVKNVQKGQRVRARVTNTSGDMVFADAIELLG